MGTIVIKTRKNLDWFLIIASLMFIMLLVHTKEYIVLFIPLLLCTTAIVLDLLLWVRWQKNPAVVLTNDFIILNHSIIFHNQKISLEHLQLDRANNALIVVNGQHLVGISKIIFKQKGILKISFHSISDENKLILLENIQLFQQNIKHL
ncbi:MAG: hypothetical protein IKS33_08935 [Bacteroidales bacterium]|nr:hypothetical protein [Bacteroidales bacterium]